MERIIIHNDQIGIDDPKNQEFKSKVTDPVASFAGNMKNKTVKGQPVAMIIIAKENLEDPKQGEVVPLNCVIEAVNIRSQEIASMIASLALQFKVNPITLLEIMAKMELLRAGKKSAGATDGTARIVGIDKEDKDNCDCPACRLRHFLFDGRK